MASVIFEEQVEVPLDVDTLDAFRTWAHSTAFPKRGRIDFVNGSIEVDMSPEDLHCHGLVKSEIVIVVGRRVRDLNLGQLYIDRARVVSPPAGLSTEPDLAFISRQSLNTGRVTLVPKAGGQPDRYIEVEGGPDLVVEILSDSSEKKDTERLPTAYYQAGVIEYWIVDAQQPEVRFEIYCRGDDAFEPASPDTAGFTRSSVLDCAYRLHRGRDADGRLEFRLKESA